MQTLVAPVCSPLSPSGSASERVIGMRHHTPQLRPPTPATSGLGRHWRSPRDSLPDWMTGETGSPLPPPRWAPCWPNALLMLTKLEKCRGAPYYESPVAISTHSEHPRTYTPLMCSTQGGLPPLLVRHCKLVLHYVFNSLLLQVAIVLRISYWISKVSDIA